MQKKVICVLLLLCALLPAVIVSAQQDAKPAMAEAPHVKYIYHTVKEGETVYSIAKHYHAEMDDIFKLNPGSQKSVWVGATLLVPSLQLADGETDEADTLHIRERLQEFVGQIYQIGSEDVGTLGEISAAKKKVKAVEAKYNVFCQAKQADMADNDALMELVAEFQQLKQETLDTLEAQRTQIIMVRDFAQSEKFIAAQLPTYRTFVSQAEKLSLVQATAAQLDQLKTKEQVVFADIEQHYQKAKAAAEQAPALAARMKKIEANYLLLKGNSEKVQEAQYKPWFDRVKDYLLGFAAVAIILMFLNMAQAKYKAFKAAREAAKKLEQFNKTNNTEYPTI